MAQSGQMKKNLELKFIKRLIIFVMLALASTSVLRFFLNRNLNSDKIVIDDDGSAHVIGKEIPPSPAVSNSNSKRNRAPTKQESKSSDDSYKEAMAFIEAGDYQSAKERLEAIIKDNPDHLKALTELGMVYLIDLRQPDMALPLFEKVISADPSNQLVVNELIGVYEELGRQEEGVGFLQGLMEKNPENSAVSLGLGQIFLGQNRTGDAIPYLEKSIQYGTQPDYVYMDLGDAYSKQGQREKAIDVYRQAVDMADRRLVESSSDQGLKQINEDMLQRNLLNYARELGNFGRYDEATQALQRIIQQSPNHQGALAEMKRFQALKRGG
ncbi:MAG: tetratricopeptide repeat protein [Pseudomonadota bacterium]